MNETLHPEKLIELDSYLKLFLQIWNFQLFSVDGQGVSVGKVTIALFLLVLGYFLSRLFSRTVRRKFLSRLQIDDSLKHTWEVFLFYFIFAGVVLFVLQLLSIPITIFALAGGALAIGIGFGSQNIVSNFISGLIVMIERPVRVNDLVEMDGRMGRIQEIGARSTIIRTIENKQVVIPNSKFLDSSFVNWTLSDPIVSNTIKVGVAYGSDVNLVRQVLEEAARSHDKVLKNEPILVLFTNFGESSLDFDIIYWQILDPSYGPMRVASDIRMKIIELFGHHKISIPFPHRQVILSKNDV